jgi:AraC-like DNA-binding protein
MSGWMSYFTGRKATTESARDAIVGLRQQLLMLEKKEEHLMKKIEEEEKKARANATSNKRRTLSAAAASHGSSSSSPFNRAFRGSFACSHSLYTPLHLVC